MATEALTNFATRFAEAWANPSAEKLISMLHPEVVLRQPHRPPIHGKQLALEEFRRLFTWLPHLHGEVDRAVEQGECVFIEWRMLVPVGASTLAIPAVDRFRVVDGLVVERVVYFDQLALAATVLTHPSLWFGYLRYLLKVG